MEQYPTGSNTQLKNILKEALRLSQTIVDERKAAQELLQQELARVTDQITSELKQYVDSLICKQNETNIAELLQNQFDQQCKTISDQLLEIKTRCENRFDMLDAKLTEHAEKTSLEFLKEISSDKIKTMKISFD